MLWVVGCGSGGARGLLQSLGLQEFIRESQSQAESTCVQLKGPPSSQVCLAFSGSLLAARRCPDLLQRPSPAGEEEKKECCVQGWDFEFRQGAGPCALLCKENRDLLQLAAPW